MQGYVSVLRKHYGVQLLMRHITSNLKSLPLNRVGEHVRYPHYQISRTVVACLAACAFQTKSPPHTAVRSSPFVKARCRRHPDVLLLWRDETRKAI